MLISRPRPGLSASSILPASDQAISASLTRTAKGAAIGDLYSVAIVILHVMSLRDIISSPLEAGTSILDSHSLPPTIRPALEYASTRLAKKSLHLTLVVVRRDYQLPPAALASPTGCIQDFGISAATPTTPGSPPLSASSTSSRFARHISRWASRVPGSPRSIISSPAFTPLSATFPAPKTAWPATPGLPMSPPPMTPGTATSSIATDGGLSAYGCDNGLRFLYSEHLPAKVERTLHHILMKAARKFRIPYV